MKYLFTLILLLILTSTTIQNPPIQLLQINAEWNTRNDVKLKLPKDYKGYRISIDYALLENQGPEFKKSVAGQPLPIVVLRVGGQTKFQWTADLSFKLKITQEEVIKTNIPDSMALDALIDLIKIWVLVINKL